MKKNGLTVSMIFEAESGNYGESTGNITTLKHMTRANGKMYTYVSRQALRYSMIQQLEWDKTPVAASGSGDKTVVQFQPDTSVKDYPEIDLFGYMKTTKGNNADTRSAVARLSNAVSLEPYAADMDFLTNMGLSKRAEKGTSNAIAQSEIHHAFYAYTITIDLDRVGIDANDGTELPNEERSKRVTDFLSCVEFLYRDIKGRRENLAPVFAIGGVYERKSPFFENRIKMTHDKLDVDMLAETVKAIGEPTMAGYVDGEFSNNDEIQDKLAPVGVAEFFKELKDQVKDDYAGC
ncbi:MULTISPECIES: type I-B CRISPR-associated protein Cas7/Cst2/DevR [Caproicibacterium]|jgi:CRISPR-associated protein Cst2|uniref:Type I-B CRISPR-associated protein Cas7/Cst2/DevR n=1 Tax=Caproicibacterium lactatifermentans TaxID=2666138 RepID=A0A859DS17_9FIRM|nr:type I-B CRISPR-associated protein Cas7/Cst2/DevR [Caproicibacterium lactatifermentans]ARP50686.1 type I-B CRISPR-associated protein Cas7/Cst2/DevR [Ruminococcaceae bacterium CPB6]QKN23582.1 type I-B CRISPR-associated protein Cas7/Cst2/DevR [Caproicibacterium lactatifermentans]